MMALTAGFRDEPAYGRKSMNNEKINLTAAEAILKVKNMNEIADTEELVMATMRCAGGQHSSSATQRPDRDTGALV